MEYAPKTLSWNLTKRCNLRCAHCYLAAGEQGEGELTTEEAWGLVSQMARAGTELVILSGGEPLMRKDVFQIARHASASGLVVVLGTNGTLITQDVVERIKEAGIQGVGISLDSLDATKHDAFRGMPGAWARAALGIRRCIAAGVPVLVQTTATPWNYPEIPDLISFASGLGATGFTLYFLVCTGRGETLTDITPEQYEQALISLAEAQARYPSLIIRAKCAPQISRIAQQAGSALTSSAGCLAGTLYGRITPEGEVTPCPYLPVPAGNTRQTELQEIWESSLVLRQLRGPALSGRCGRCEFQAQCGGCRARAYATGGTLWGEDPFCSYQPSGEPASAATPLVWAEEAVVRLQRVPGFIRARVKAGVDGFARSRGYTKVDVTVMEEVLRAVGKPGYRAPARSEGAPSTSPGAAGSVAPSPCSR